MRRKDSGELKTVLSGENQTAVVEGAAPAPPSRTRSELSMTVSG